MLNRKQKLVLLAGILVTVIMGVYPPWLGEFKDEDLHLPPGSWGYGWLFSKHPLLINDVTFIIHLDVTRLLVQWSLVWILTGGLLWTFHRVCNATSISETASQDSAPGVPKRSPAAPSPRVPVVPMKARSQQCNAIRQKIRMAVMYDEDKVDRLVDLERKLSPGATDEELHTAAYDRWVRDNR